MPAGEWLIIVAPFSNDHTETLRQPLTVGADSVRTGLELTTSISIDVSMQLLEAVRKQP